jgi:hypothetical protein
MRRQARSDTERASAMLTDEDLKDPVSDQLM